MVILGDDGLCTRILRSILVLLSCLCLPRRVPRSCRQRHWYASAGFTGVDALRAMFPSFVSVAFFPGSCIFKVCIAGDNVPCAVFSSQVSTPMMLCIMAVLDQKNSLALFPGSDMYKADLLVTLHFALCSFPWLAGSRCSSSWPV